MIVWKSGRGDGAVIDELYPHAANELSDELQPATSSTSESAGRNRRFDDMRLCVLRGPDQPRDPVTERVPFREDEC